MKRKQKTLLSFLMVMAMMLVNVPQVQAENNDPYANWDTIKVFETTDVHGYITDVSTYEEETFQYRLAYIAKIVNDARKNKEYEGVLLLDGGDIYQSTPHSNLTFGAPMRAAYDKMQYDAVALGNHEFDWDVQKYAADEQGTIAPYEIGSYKGDPNIPVLAGNIYYKQNGQRVPFTQDYTVVKKGDYDIAIVGYVEDYTNDIKASQIAPYKIDADLNKLSEKTKEVKEKTKADVVMVLAHGEPEPIAKAMNPEVVDLVLGGHSHKKNVGTAENGIDYIQGNSKAYGYASAEVKINPENNDVEVVEPSYVDTTAKENVQNLYYQNGNNPHLDKEITKISQAAWDEVKDEMYEVLCTVDKNITKSPIQEGTTTSIAGNWLAGLMLDATKEQNTVAAFTNSGGIRTDILLEEGMATREVTVADIYTITPFGNRIYTYEITGKQMAQQLENALLGTKESSNFGDQFSGITVTYEKADGKIKVTSMITDSGEEISVYDTEKKYPVCVNEYCATLDGSVFKDLKPLVPTDDAPVDNLSAIQALRDRRDVQGLKLELDTKVRAIEQPIGTYLVEEVARLEKEVQLYKIETIKSSDMEKLQQLNAKGKELMANPNITEEQKSRVNKIAEHIKVLLERVALAKSALETENINKADRINVDNVKVADKKLLENAKKDLEMAEKLYKGNYTEEELKLLKMKVEQVQKNLEEIDKLQNIIKPESSGNVTSNPKTVDTAQVMIWLIMMTIATGSLVALKYKKKN